VFGYEADIHESVQLSSSVLCIVYVMMEPILLIIGYNHSGSEHVKQVSFPLIRTRDNSVVESNAAFALRPCTRVRLTRKISNGLLHISVKEVLVKWGGIIGKQMTRFVASPSGVTVILNPFSQFESLWVLPHAIKVSLTEQFGGDYFVNVTVE